MDASKLLGERLDILLACDDKDVVQEEGAASSKLSSTEAVAYEHERYLVAWVLLTRLSQDYLNKAWEKHKNKLSFFAARILTCNADTLLRVYYLRLVALATSRLSVLPSENLRNVIYRCWKETRGDSLSLNIDICNTYIAWMEKDSFLFSYQILEDLWEIYSNISSASNSITRQTTNTDENDETTMINVLHSLLSTDDYSVSNLQEVIFCLFEIHGTSFASNESSDDLHTKIIIWFDTNSQEEAVTHQDLKFMWHGYIFRYVCGIISTKKQPCTLLREPKMMNFMQNITLAHAVSPDVGALRGLAWHTINKIIQGYGYSFSEKSSSNAPICTWCRLACGECKIQLEEDEMNSSSDILGGCAEFIVNVVHYLADFDERPDKSIPLDSEGMFHLKFSLEEALHTTSEYLSRSTDDGIKSVIVTNLFSHLFSDLYHPTLEKSDIIIDCLKNLLMISTDLSLMRSVVHIDRLGFEHNLKNESIIAYIERSWHKMAERNWPSPIDQSDVIYWACIATEIFVAENQHKVLSFMHQVISILVESLQNDPSKQQKGNLRHVVKSYMEIIDDCHHVDPTQTDILSFAIDILKKN